MCDVRHGRDKRKTTASTADLSTPPTGHTEYAATKVGCPAASGQCTEGVRRCHLALAAAAATGQPGVYHSFTTYLRSCNVINKTVFVSSDNNCKYLNYL